MEKFKPIDSPIEVDFFTILEYDGVKQIHLHGFTYPSDDCWVNVEICGLILPLEEFINGLDGNRADNLYCSAKQYARNYYADEDIVNVINHYYRDIVFPLSREGKEGAPEAYLDFNEITMDTPCGEYVTTPIDE